MNLYSSSARFLRGGALLVLALGFTLRAADLKQATVTQTFNDVRVIAPDAADQPATSGARIEGEKGVKTGDKSRAELEFQDKTLTRLGANTIFSFDGGTRSMEMQQGTMLLQVPKNAGGAKIRTAAVTAAITGTTILLEYTPDREVIEGGVKKKKKGKIKVIVLEGQLRLSLNNGSGQTVTLNGGQMLVCDPATVSLPQPAEVDVSRLVASSLLVNNAFWGQEAALAAGQTVAQAAAAAAAGAGTNGGRLNFTLIDQTIAQQQQAIANGTLGPASAILTLLGNEVVLIGTFDPLAQVNQSVTAGNGVPPLPPLPPNDGPKNGPLPAVAPGEFVIDSSTIAQLDPVITTGTNNVQGRIYRGAATDGSPVAYAFGEALSRPFDLTFGFSADAFFAPVTFPAPGVTFFRFESLRLAGTPLFVTTGGPTSLALLGVNGITTATSGSLDFSSLSNVFLATQSGAISLNAGFTVSGGNGDRLTLYARGNAGDLGQAGVVSGFSQVRAGAERDLLLAGGGRLAAGTRAELVAGRNLTLNGQLAAPNVVLTSLAGTLSLAPAGLDTGVILDLNATAPTITLTGSLNAGATASQLRFNAGGGGFNAGTFTLAGTARQISVNVTGGGSFAAGAFTGSALTLSGGGAINVAGALDVTTLTFDGAINAGSITAGTINATNATFGGAVNAGTINVVGTSLTLNAGGSGSFNVPAGATLTFAGAQAFDPVNVSGPGSVLFSGSGLRNVGTYAVSGATTITGGTVRVGGTASLATLTLSLGTIDGAGNIAVAGPFSWTGGSIVGSGLFDVNGDLTISGVTTKTLGRGLFTRGLTTLSGGDIAGTTPFGRIVNSGDFRFTDNAGVSGIGFTNTGVLTKTGAATTTTLASLSNAGTVSVASGTLRVSAGNATGGSITVAAGAALELNGFTQQAGSLTGAGRLQLSNFSATGGSLVFAGLTDLPSGPAIFDIGASLADVNLAGGDLGGAGLVRTSGLLAWTAGAMSGSGTTSADGALTISGVATKSLSGQRTLVANGSTAFSGGNLAFSGNAQFFNAGTFSVTDGASFTGSSTDGFINATGATFTKSGVGSTTTVSVPFANLGTLQVSGGTLAFQDAFNQSSGSTTLAGGSLSTSGTLNFNAGLLTGSGTIAGNVTSGNATIQPTIGAGSTGLAISGQLTLLGGSNLNFTLGGLTAGSGYGTLSAGSAVLGGNLVLSFANGTENLLTTGTTFTLLTTSSALAGTFVNVAPGGRLATTDNLGTFLVSYSGNTLTLSNFIFSAVTDAIYLGGTNNWSTAAGWSSNPAVPNNGVRTFNVFVNGGNLTQDIVGDVFVQRLTMTGGTISLPNALFLNDGLTYSGGTVQNGNLTIAGGTSTASTTLGFSNVNFVLGGTLAVNFSGNLFAGAVDFANAATGVVLFPLGGNVTLNAVSGLSSGAFLLPGGSRLNLLSGFVFSGHRFLGGGDVFLNNGQSTTFQALVQNDVTFTLASAGSFTDLFISGTVQLDGTGTLVLGDSGRVRSTGAGPATLINLGNVIRGTSTGGGSLGSNDVALDNRGAGVIEADGAGNILLVDPAPTGGLLNAGILRARNGGVLQLSGAGGGDFVNTASGLIEAQAGSEVQLTSGANVSGGVLGGTGVFRNLNLASLSNLSLQSTFIGANGSTTNLSGAIDNRGTLRLESAGSFTDLVLTGTVTLSGGGTVTLGNTGRVRSGGAGVLINVDNTIDGESTGGGSLGAGSLAIVNQAGGVIVANVSGRTLRLDPGTGGLTNAGTLRALDGGVLLLSGLAGGAFDNTGGTIEAQTASEVQFEGASVSGGTLLGTGGLFRNLSAATLRDVILNGPFVANNGTSTTLAGTLTNNGSVLLQTTGSFTDLFLSGDVTLAGNGTLTLGDSARVRGQVGAEILTNLGNTISGESTAGGSLGANSIGILNAAGGTIVANVSGRFLLVDPDPTHGLVNQGLMLADNGGQLRLTGAGGGAFDNAGGVIRANTGSEVQLTAGASVVGGTLSSVGSGLIRVLDVATLSDLTLAGNVIANNNSSTTLSGNIVNSGTLTLAASGSFTDLFLGGVTLSGGGTVVLQDAARLRGSGLFTNLDNTLRGATPNSGSFGANELTIVNEALGRIDADVSGLSLTLDPDAGNLTNRGQLRALNGGILVLSGAGGGDVDNTGGIISAATGSEVQLTGGVTVVGGTLNGAGSGLFRNLSTAVLGGLTLNGNFVANNGTTTTLFGNVVNQGVLTVAASGSFTDLSMEGPVTLSGGGQIVLQDAARVRSALTGSSLINVDNLIRGATPSGGSLGAGEIAITNQAAGVVSADVAGQALVVDPGSAGGFVNRGLLQATGGGILALSGNGGGRFDNTGGTVRAFAGSEVRLSDNVTLSGGTLQADPGGLLRVTNFASLEDFALQGLLQVNNGGTLTLSGTVGGVNARVAVAAVGSFTDVFFNGTTTFSGALRLQDAARLRGSGTAPTLTNLGTIGGETGNGGSLGADSLGLVNTASGVIVADQAGLALVVDPSTAGLTNAGLLRATGGGNLVLSGNGGGGFSNTGTIEVAPGSRVTVGGTLTSSGTVDVGSGQLVVQSVGSFTQTGGTFQIAGGTVSNTAPLVFSGGLLTGFGTIGSLDNAGTIRPAIGAGSTGLSVGGLLLQGTSRLEFTIGGLVQGSGYGFLAASGSVTLGGQIVVSFANGFGSAISPGDTFTILTGGSIGGAFTTPLPGGRVFTADGLGSFQFTLTSTSIVLSNFSVAAALAANYAGGTGNWSDPTFWSTNPLVPNNGNGGSTFNVTIGSGTLTQDIAAGVTVQTLTLNGGTIFFPTGNTLTTNGLLTWSSNAALQGAGTVTAAGGALFGGSAFSDLTGGVTFVLPAGQTATQNGTNEIRLGGGAVFQNQGTFLAQTNFGLSSLPGGGVFNNTGTFTRDTQTGTSTIGGGVAFNNSGTVNVQTGTLSLNGGGVASAGVFNVAAGATLRFGGAYTLATGASVVNAGVVDFGFGNSTVGGSLTGAGEVRFTSGTTAFTASQSVGALTFAGGSISLGAGLSLTAGGPLDWSGTGVFDGGGTLFVNAGGTLGGSVFSDVLGGSTLILASGQTVTHSGSNQIRLGGGASIVNQGLFVEQTIFGASGQSGGGTFSNSGTFQRSGSTGTAALAVTFNNSGSVDVQTGTLALNGGGSSTGSFNVASGATLAFGSAYALAAGSTVANAGLLEFTGGNSTIGGNITGPGGLRFSGGAAAFTASQVVGAVTVAGGSVGLAAGVNLTAGGPFTWSPGGVISGAGALVANAGGTIGGSGFSDLTVGATLTLAAGQNVVHSDTNQIRLGGGATVANFGTFDEQTNFGVGVLAGGGTFRNHGTFLRSTSSAAAPITAVFDNSGLVSVTSGMLDLNGGGTSTGGIFQAAAGTMLRFGGNFTFDAASQLDGGGAIEFRAGTQTFGGSYLGTGTLVVSGGALTFTADQSLATLQLSGGSLAAGAGRSVTINSPLLWNVGTAALTGGGTFNANGGATFGGSAFSDLLGGSILNLASGQTALHNGSNQIRLGGGSSLRNAGVFQADNDSGIAAAAGSGSVSNSGTFVRANSGGPYAIAVPFANSSTVNVNSGTLRFDAGYTQSAGSLNLNGGALGGSTLTLNGGVLTGFGTVSAALQNSAQITPALVGGGLLVNGNVSLLTGSQLTFNLGGLTQGSQYGFLGVNGSVTLGGTLAVFFTGGFQSSVTGANTFTLLTSSSALAGAFANIASGSRLPTGDGFGSFLVTYAGNSVVLSNFISGVAAVWTGTSGNWNAGANWSGGTVPNSATLDVLIDSGRTGVASNVLMNGNFAVRDLTIDAGDALAIATGFTLTINGVLRNDGAISLQSGAGATLAFVNATTLTGSGSLTLASGSVLSSPSGLTNAAGHTLGGTGSITGPFTNRGTVNANAGTLTFNNGFNQDAASGQLTLGGGQVSAPTPFIIGAGSVGGFGTISGGLDVSGTLAPVGGVLNVNGGPLTLRSGATFQLTLAGTVGGTQYSLASVSGAVGLGGTLAATFAGGFGSGVRNADVFNFLSTSGTLSGNFANVLPGSRVSTTDGLGSFLFTRSTNILTLSDFLATITNPLSVSWLTATTNNWTNAASWSGGQVPNDTAAANGTGYNVTIAATGAPYTVSLSSGSFTVQSLNLNSANATLALGGVNLRALNGFTLQAGTLTMNGTTLRGSTLALTGGQLAPNSSGGNILDGLAVTGTLTLGTTSAALRLQNGATLTGTANVSGAGAVLGFEQTRTLSGLTVNLGSAGTTGFLSIESTNTVTLDSTVVVRGAGGVGGARLIGGNQTLINQGSITADLAGQSLIINPNLSFVNAGTVSALNGSILTVGASGSSTVTNTGTITANNSTVNFSADFTGAGVGTVNATNSTLNLQGQFRTAGLAGINRTGGSITLGGSLDNSGSTFAFTTALGSITLANGLVSGGSVNGASNPFLFNSGGSNRFNGVAVFNGLTLGQTSSTLRLSGGSTLAGSVVLSGSGATLGIEQSGTLDGFTVDLGSAGISAFFSIESTNTLTLGPGVSIRGVGGIGSARIISGTSTLINQGFITADLSGQALTISANNFTNQGTLGALNGATLNVGNATSQVYSNSGVIGANNSTLVFGADFTGSGLGTVNATNSTVTLAGNFLTSGLGGINRTGGVLQLTGFLDNTGNTLGLVSSRGIIQLNSGRVLGGTIDNSAGQAFEFSSTASNRFDGVSVTGGLQMSLTGSLLVLLNGSQIGGPVTLNGPGANLAVNQTATMQLQVALGTAATQAFLSIEGTNTLTLASGSLIRGAGAVGSARVFSGTSTLINGGSIEADTAGQTLTLNPNVLINNGTLAARNGGTLTIASATAFTNNGSILVDAGTLNLPGSYGPALLAAIAGQNGGVINLSGTLNNTGQTTTLPAAGGAFTLAGGTIRGGALLAAPNAGAAPLLFTTSTLNILDGVALDGAFTLGPSQTVRLQNGSIITGSFSLAGASSTLSIEQTATLSGPLAITLGANSAVLGIGGGNTFTIGGMTTVAGFGQVGPTLFGGGTNHLVNQGVLSANVAGQTLAISPNGTFVNQGVVDVGAGAILTFSTNWTNGGTITVASGGTLNLNGTYLGTAFGSITNSAGTINLGGTFNNAGLTTTLPASATAFVLNGGTITGGTLNVAPEAGAAALGFSSNSNNILSGVAVNGTLTLNASHSLRFNSGTGVAGAINLTGANSTLSLEQTSTLALVTLNLGATSATVGVGGGNTITIGGSALVRGFGAIGGTIFGGGTNSLVNQGTIAADVSGSTLLINPNGTFTNSNLLQASGGGVLTLNTAWNNAVGTISVGTGSTLNLGGTFSGNALGTINNSGGTVNITGAFNNTGLTTTLPASAGTFTLNGGTITGGTLNVAPSSGAAGLALTGSSNNILSGVRVVGDLTLGSASTLRLNSGSTFQGNVTLGGANASVSVEQTATFAGPLTLNLGATSVTFGVGGGNTLTLGSAVTARGFGALGGTIFGGGTNSLVNQGTIAADVGSSTLLINPNGTLTNTGTLQASNGGVLTLNTAWNNAGGTISIGAGSVVNLGGTFTGTALGTINNSGGTVNITGAFNNTGLTTTLPASAGTFTLSSGTITGGTLNVGGSAAALSFNSSSTNQLSGVAVVGNLSLPTSSTVRLNSGASITGTVDLPGSATVSYEQTATVSNATFNLNGSSNSIGIGGGNTLTLAATTFVRGAGQFGLAIFGGGTNQLVNQGTLTADVAGLALTVNPNGAFTNSGTINVLNGGIFTLAGGAASTSPGSIVVTNGTLNLNRTINVASLTGGTATIGIQVANDVTAPNGFAFNGVSGTTATDGGSLTLNTPGLTLGVGAGQINGLTANGGDSSAGAGGSGGSITVSTSATDLNVNANIDATSGASASATGGNGGSVTLNANGGSNAVNVTSRIRVSDSTAGRRSSRGGNISINSARATGTAINISSTAQLHALLDAAAPGPGGTINIVATGNSGSNIAVAGNVRADRGTVQIRHNGNGGTVNVASTASVRADVVKIGALGNNGILTIAGGTFDADTTIRLYATGSNGQVLFTGNTTLQGTSVKQIAGQTVTIQNGVQVNVLGTGPAQVFTNVPNYSGSGGNGSTTGTFTGQGATTQPLGNAPGF
ncbi:MAG: FecR domain-containing protein [Verrucomicrobia bacterium]|nr:FecR domain-containing protein [Verrucomicrobiota bacterium]